VIESEKLFSTVQAFITIVHSLSLVPALEVFDNGKKNQKSGAYDAEKKQSVHSQIKNCVDHLSSSDLLAVIVIIPKTFYQT